MAKSETFWLSLSNSNKIYYDADDKYDNETDDDDIRTVCSQLPDDDDDYYDDDDDGQIAYRILKQSELRSVNHHVKEVEENVQKSSPGKLIHTDSVNSIKIPHGNMDTFQQDSGKLPVRYNRDGEELVQEQAYQTELKKRICQNENVDAKYLFPTLSENEANNGRKRVGKSDGKRGSFEEDLYDSLEMSSSDLKNESINPNPCLEPEINLNPKPSHCFTTNTSPNISPDYNSNPNHNSNLNPSLSHNLSSNPNPNTNHNTSYNPNHKHNPSLSPNPNYNTNNNPNSDFKTVQNKFDDRLDQFYLKTPPQKKNKVTGPVKGDHDICVQKWPDEQVYNEFKKMADSYRGDSMGLYLQEQTQKHPLKKNDNYSLQNSYNDNTKNQIHFANENMDSLPFVRQPPDLFKTSFNYVEFNKSNYDKIVKNRTYKDLHYQKKNGNLLRDIHSGKSEPIDHYQELMRPVIQRKPLSAEDLWRKRSTQLIHEQGQKFPAAGKLQKFPSDSNVNYQTKPYHLKPLRPIPTYVPQPQGENSGNSGSMYQNKVIDLDPISKDFITDDGQRISVDINLKLVSPPTSSRYHPSYAVSPADNSHTSLQRMPDYQNTDQYADYEKLLMDYELQHRTREDNSLNNPENSMNEAGERLEKTDHNTSYTGRYQKLRKADFKYKVYTVDDYRKMDKEVKLGRLGPDLDSDDLKEKIERRQRQAEYARKVHEENRTAISSKPLAPPPCPPLTLTKEQESKRKMAIQYSKTVPKPAVKPIPSKENKPKPANKTSALAPDSLLFNLDDIEKLREQHERDKKAAEAIRQRLNVKT
ncbi:jhy protein homolog [Argonauta hians]